MVRKNGDTSASNKYLYTVECAFESLSPKFSNVFWITLMGYELEEISTLQVYKMKKHVFWSVFQVYKMKKYVFEAFFKITKRRNRFFLIFIHMSQIWKTSIKIMTCRSIFIKLWHKFGLTSSKSRILMRLFDIFDQISTILRTSALFIIRASLTIMIFLVRLW